MNLMKNDRREMRMAKELTEFDVYKKQYSELQKINQRLKNICSIYYISHTGGIHMKSLVHFLEKVGTLNDPKKIDRFYGAMILPNEFFEFSKNAKKTKLTIDYSDPTKIIFGQNDSDLTLTINIVNSDPNIDENYIKTRIDPKMDYKRMTELNDASKYYWTPTKYDGEMVMPPVTEYQCTEQDVIDLVDGSPVFIRDGKVNLTLAKQILLDIKKTDQLKVSWECFQIINKSTYRVFYMIEQTTDIYSCWTLFNILQSE